MDPKMEEEEEKTLKSSLIKWSLRCTMHGVVPIVNNKSVLIKLVWAVCLIIAARFCYVFSASQIRSFIAFEVDTIVELVKEGETDFPTVTICNMQICGFREYNSSKFFDEHVMDEQKKTNNARQVLDEKLRKNSTKTSFFLAREIFLRKYNDSELTRILNRNSTQVSSMLISCHFGGRECNESDFEFTPMGEFQKCYKFNANAEAPKRAKKYRKEHGLRLELYVGSQEDCKSPLSSTSGLIIYVHEPTYTITEEDNAILAAPGTETNVQISRTTIEKMAYPYSNCIGHKSLDLSTVSNLTQQTITYTGIYTQQYCLQLCYQQFLLKYCNCYDHTLPGFNPGEKSACPKFIDSLYNCQYLIKRLFYNGKNDRHCILACPNECEFVSFGATVSTAKFPSKAYAETLHALSEDTAFEGVKLDSESTLAINIFFASDAFTRINERPHMNTELFVSNFGGTLGLFIGISLLSFCELIELVIEIVLWRCRGPPSRKIKNSD